MSDDKRLLPELLPAPRSAEGRSPSERVAERARTLLARFRALGPAAGAAVLSIHCSYGVVDPLPPPPAECSEPGGATGEDCPDGTDTGGKMGTGGRGGGGTGGAATGGRGGESAPDAAIGDAAADTAGSPDVGTDAPEVVTGQGPEAEGTIEYDQDFEKDMAGLERSPPSLPASRAEIVDDPLGQRGKVLRIQWLPGDDFRSAPQFKPESFVSNASAFHYAAGDRISQAWGYMTESTYIGATLAQNITGGDPVWMIQGRDDGIIDMLPGMVRLPIKLEAKKWYDFRVEVNYVAGAAGSIELYINGTKVFSHTGGLPIGAEGHWDGGIHLTDFGVLGNGLNTPRTVYFSNLSCGRK